MAQQHVRAILGASNILEDLPTVLRPLRPVLWWVMKAATISTLPRWLRRVAGVRQNRVTRWELYGGSRERRGRSAGRPDGGTAGVVGD